MMTTGNALNQSKLDEAISLLEIALDVGGSVMTKDGRALTQAEIIDLAIEILRRIKFEG